MFYKLTDMDTSHDDWISLNMDRVHSDLIVRACPADEAYEMIEWLNPPDQEDDEDPPTLYGGLVPAQSYVYVLTHDNDDRPAIREALDASGFEMFTTSGDHPVPFFFGIDGGGYSFIGAHWIPARARMAAIALLDTTYTEAETGRLRNCLTQWEQDMQRGGDDLRKACPEVYEALEQVIVDSAKG